MAAVLVDYTSDGTSLHHARGALPRHREFQDVRSGEPADQWRSRLDHGARVDHAEARSLRKMAYELRLGLRHHPVCHDLRPWQYLREGPQPGEAAMMGSTIAH